MSSTQDEPTLVNSDLNLIEIDSLVDVTATAPARPSFLPWPENWPLEKVSDVFSSTSFTAVVVPAPFSLLLLPLHWLPETTRDVASSTSFVTTFAPAPFTPSSPHDRLEQEQLAMDNDISSSLGSFSLPPLPAAPSSSSVITRRYFPISEPQEHFFRRPDAAGRFLPTSRPLMSVPSSENINSIAPPPTANAAAVNPFPLANPLSFFDSHLAVPVDSAETYNPNKKSTERQFDLVSQQGKCVAWWRY